MNERYAVDPSGFTEGKENPDGPIIAVSGSMSFPGMDEAARDMTHDLAQIAFEAIREQGGRPRLYDAASSDLPPADEILATADGLFILGGGDVDGSCYGYDGPPPANEYGVDKRADTQTIRLIQEAVRRDLPLLAVCRGSQLLNVSFGGTLIPDIVPSTLHRGDPAHEGLFIDEEVMLEPASEIARILGGVSTVTVRNGHHQAVDQVGPELWVTAHAHDGIVEATQHRTASWVLGIQWHPEEPEASPVHRALIIGELVRRASGQ